VKPPLVTPEHTLPGLHIPALQIPLQIGLKTLEVNQPITQSKVGQIADGSPTLGTKKTSHQ
jgi:hypothetical protein